MKRITEDGEIIDEITYETVAMAPPFFKTPWNHDTELEAINVALECKDPSRTQQQFAAESDINNILAKFNQTGDVSLLGTHNPVYRDILEEFDLQTSIVTSHQVNEAWNALSPEVRNTLKDPKTFADYVEHCLQTGDLAPLEALGLAKKGDQPEVVPPVPPEVKTPPTA